MHFVTGGAFNGKSKWVWEVYQLEREKHRWISAYKGDSIQEPGPEPIVVYEGVEAWLEQQATQAGLQHIREEWQARLEALSQWERGLSGRRVVLIGTDMSKGIVPVSAGDRKWRDLAGWIYQDMVAASEQADIIWYGIRQKLK